MDAIILAGALNTGLLRQVSSARYEAAIEIAGQPMVEYVIRALQEVPEIDKIAIVGSKSIMRQPAPNKLIWVEPGESLVDSLINGLKVLNPSCPVLVVTSDIPLITREALEDFLSRCRRVKGDLHYSFVPKEVNEAKYPGVKRTYVKLKEGTFTGGNLLLLSETVARDHQLTLKKAASLRKKPFLLCSMLGWRCLFRFILGQLKISEIEAQVSKAFNFNAVGVVSPFPEVGIDVDKPSDWSLAVNVLSKLKESN